MNVRSNSESVSSMSKLGESITIVSPDKERNRLQYFRKIRNFDQGKREYSRTRQLK